MLINSKCDKKDDKSVKGTDYRRQILTSIIDRRTERITLLRISTTLRACITTIYDCTFTWIRRPISDYISYSNIKLPQLKCTSRHLPTLIQAKYTGQENIAKFKRYFQQLLDIIWTLHCTYTYFFQIFVWFFFLG